MYRGKITSGIVRQVKTDTTEKKGRKSKLSGTTVKALSILLGIYLVSVGTIYFFDISERTDSRENGFEMIFSHGEEKDNVPADETDVYDKLTEEYQASVEASAKAYIEKIEQQLDVTVYGENKPVFLSSDKAMPVNGTVTSGYSRRKNPFYAENSGAEEYEFHKGLDIEVPVGTSVFSYSDGRVVTASASDSYGNYMIVSHGDCETLYAHLDTLIAKKGDTVKAGQTIAFSGNTGRSTGPHLHFEVRVNGEAVDPALYLTDTGEDGV
ncbi:MAG: M23 family metallopeptidase [Clostridia bacterium]|nr:M23 family metallopeptidase [Clostridia bacterium]